MKIHKDVTLDRVMAAVERQRSSLDVPGVCIACGAEVGGVEPDAEEYECECCGEEAVYGAEQLLIMMA
jgi:predicted RNA-binding Zn-ribbon protein involved in translation (DUF1610 family)